MLSIVKRNSVYYFRIRIPADVRQYFPSAEIMKSLRTQLYRQAKGLARKELGALEKVFMAIRSGVLTEDEIVRLVAKYKREQLGFHDRLMDDCVAAYHAQPTPEDLEWMDEDEIGELQEGEAPASVRGFRKLLLDIQQDMQQKAADRLLDMRGMDELTMRTARHIIKQYSVDQESDEFKSLCRAVALADREICDTLIQRTATGDSDYDRQERERPRSKTLKELIELYHRENAEGWADPASTKAIHSRILHMLGDHPLADIDREMCIQFREDLKEYPLKNSDFVTPWQILSKRKKRRLSERTQNGTISELITLFNYANDNHLGIKGNPARNLLKRKEDCAPVKVREYYTTDELNKMIQALAKVNRTSKPETFWIPLLLLYTGARANEICMLRCDDVAKEGESWFIHFRNLPQYHQRTKNAEDRRAPVHNHLQEIGFLEFVNQQRGAGKDRIFSSLKLRDGKWNTDYGKNYNRTFKKKFLQGYTHEELRAKDLHTFRVTLISWFVKNGMVNDMLTFETLRSIVGHFEDKETSAIMKYLQSVKLTLQGYGGGFKIDPVAFLSQLDYGIDLSPLKA